MRSPCRPVGGCSASVALPLGFVEVGRLSRTSCQALQPGALITPRSSGSGTAPQFHSFAPSITNAGADAKAPVRFRLNGTPCFGHLLRSPATASVVNAELLQPAPSSTTLPSA